MLRMIRHLLDSGLRRNDGHNKSILKNHRAHAGYLAEVAFCTVRCD